MEQERACLSRRLTAELQCTKAAYRRVQKGQAKKEESNYGKEYLLEVLILFSPGKKSIYKNLERNAKSSHTSLSSGRII